MNAGHASDTMDKRVSERIRMNISPKEYNRCVARLAKKSPLGKDLLNSFLLGGLICVIGQLILNGYTALEPVSYTHLDVDKRQGRYSADEQSAAAAPLRHRRNVHPAQSRQPVRRRVRAGRKKEREMCIRDRASVSSSVPSRSKIAS